jgi:D-alanyl-D-alanine carboxypeptidase
MSRLLGTVWGYEGETYGFRMVYVYLPKQDAVIALGANSATDPKQDASKKLAIALYETLRKAGRL